jgi:hypothetical protein
MNNEYTPNNSIASHICELLTTYIGSTATDIATTTTRSVICNNQYQLVHLKRQLTKPRLLLTIIPQRMCTQKLTLVNNFTVGIAHVGAIVILHGLVGGVD